MVDPGICTEEGGVYRDPPAGKKVSGNAKCHEDSTRCLHLLQVDSGDLGEHRVLGFPDWEKLMENSRNWLRVLRAFPFR